WQGSPKGKHPGVFGFVADLPPTGMITKLFSATVIAASRLQMAVWVGTDPNLRPGGRDCQCLDPPQNFGFMNQLAGGIPKTKCFAGAFAGNPGHIIRNVTQADEVGGLGAGFG